MTVYEIFVISVTTIWLSIFIGWIGAALHMANTQGDFLVSHFSKSPGLILARIHMESRSWRRISAISAFALAILFYKYRLKYGMLNPVELASLPLPIRRKLKWIGVAGVTYFSIMLFGGLVVIYVDGF